MQRQADNCKNRLTAINRIGVDGSYFLVPAAATIRFIRPKQMKMKNQLSDVSHIALLCQSSFSTLYSVYGNLSAALFSPVCILPSFLPPYTIEPEASCQCRMQHLSLIVHVLFSPPDNAHLAGWLQEGCAPELQQATVCSSPHSPCETELATHLSLVSNFLADGTGMKF